jgi:hypothetical protein
VSFPSSLSILLKKIYLRFYNRCPVAPSNFSVLLSPDESIAATSCNIFRSLSTTDDAGRLFASLSVTAAGLFRKWYNIGG